MGTVISMLWNIQCIGDHMNSNLANSLILLYRLLLTVYPPAYCAQLGNEMYDTFLDGVEEAGSQGRLGRFLSLNKKRMCHRQS